MSNGWQYVLPGYAVVLGGVSVYAYWLIRRGKRLAEQVPEEKRRFLD